MQFEKHLVMVTYGEEKNNTASIKLFVCFFFLLTQLTLSLIGNFVKIEKTVMFTN